jgi:hypothetical protein
MKLLSTFVALGFLSSAHAASAACTDKHEILNNTQVQRVNGQNGCFLTVHPRDAFQTLIYRDFLFDEDGLFMIFNSYGPGDESRTTAAREFRFFPRGKADLSYSYDAATQRLNVTTPSGKVFVFNTQKTILVSVSGSQIAQDYSVNPNNRGGIEFTKNDGLMLDGGFKIGSSPSQNSKNKIVFKDADARQCQLANGDVYRYTVDDDVIFRYDDAQLKSVLNNKCPNLQF